MDKIRKFPDIPPFMTKNRSEFKFTQIDLFVGIRGIRHGFQRNEGYTVYSSEWDKYAQKTYTANFGEVPDGDITQVDENSIPDHDILLGGFSCQTFLQAGLKKMI